jgi:hypothetical protein
MEIPFKDEQTDPKESEGMEALIVPSLFRRNKSVLRDMRQEIVVKKHPKKRFKTVTIGYLLKDPNGIVIFKNKSEVQVRHFWWKMESPAGYSIVPVTEQREIR